MIYSLEACFEIRKHAFCSPQNLEHKKPKHLCNNHHVRMRRQPGTRWLGPLTHYLNEAQDKTEMMLKRSEQNHQIRAAQDGV